MRFKFKAADEVIRLCTSNSSYGSNDATWRVWLLTRNCHRPLQGAREYPPLVLRSCCSHHTEHLAVFLHISKDELKSDFLCKALSPCLAAQSVVHCRKPKAALARPLLLLFWCFFRDQATMDALQLALISLTHHDSKRVGHGPAP